MRKTYTIFGAAEYKLQQAWLDTHREATFIKYDTNLEIPSEAIYVNPLYQIEAETQLFWQSIQEAMPDES